MTPEELDMLCDLLTIKHSPTPEVVIPIEEYIDPTQPKTTPEVLYTVKLPPSLHSAIMGLDLGKGKAALKRRDRLMVFCSSRVERVQSYRVRHGRWQTSFPIGKQAWRDLAGTATYKPYQAMLEKAKILTVWTSWYGVESYQPGVTSKQYSLHLDWCKESLKSYDLSFPCKNDSYTLQQEWLLESYKHLKVPTIKAVEDVSDKYLGTYTHKGQMIVPEWVCGYFYGEESKKGIISVEEHLDIYRRFSLNVPRYIFNGRFIESVTSLPSWIRDNHLLLDGEFTARCDFKALHHNIWYKIFKDYESLLDPKDIEWWGANCCGDGHTGIAKALCEFEGVPATPETLKAMRDHVKLESLSHYNTTAYCMLHDVKGKPNRLGNLFYAKCPSCWKFIINTKRGPKGYCNTSYLLTRVEAQLIQACILALAEMDIHCIYVHDCLMVAESNQAHASIIMSDIAHEMGIPTLVS